MEKFYRSNKGRINVKKVFSVAGITRGPKGPTCPTGTRSVLEDHKI